MYQFDILRTFISHPAVIAQSYPLIWNLKDTYFKIIFIDFM